MPFKRDLGITKTRELKMRVGDNQAKLAEVWVKNARKVKLLVWHQPVAPSVSNSRTATKIASDYHTIQHHITNDK